MAYLKLGGFVFVLFTVCYSFTNWLAFEREHTFRLWMDWELGIPFVPSSLIVYLSLDLALLLPLFCMTPDQMKRLGHAMTVALFVAVVFFLILPAKIGWMRDTSDPFWGPYYEGLFKLDKSANTFPSLHITFSFLFIRAALEGAQAFLTKIIFWSWFVLICLSVLLTHQHHVADIIGGLILGEVCFLKCFLRRPAPEQ